MKLPIAAALLLLASPALAAGKLELTVVDSATGEPLPCRMHLTNQQGKPQRAGRAPFWHDHFVFPGKITLKLPRGQYTFEIEHGPEYPVQTGNFQLTDQSDDRHTVTMTRMVDMRAEGWWSGDLHVHRPLSDIKLLMQAEDLHVAPVITWWNQKSEWSDRQLPADPLVRFDENRFFHQLAGEDERAGGALLFFNLARPLDLTKAQPEHPSPMTFVEAADQDPNAWIDIEKPFWWDVPVWVASGKVDSIGLANNHMCRSEMYSDEAWGKPRDRTRLPNPTDNGRWSQEIYYHLLDCGLRIPPSAGSASGVLPNPVGYNRVYVFLGDELDYGKWWDGLRAGRVIVTNGPLIRPIVAGQLPGHVFREPEGSELSLDIVLKLSTRDPISYLEVIKNGEVERAVRLDELSRGGALQTLRFDESGWFLIRAVADVDQTFRFCSTGPYYVEIGETPRISRQSAQFFLDWVNERAGRIELDDPDQRREVVQYHDEARVYWEDLVERANAE